MLPYLFLLLLVTLVVYTGSLATERRSVVGLLAAAFLLVMFAGFRDRSVGTDTRNYIEMYKAVGGISDIWRTSEYGFNALMVFCSQWSQNYTVLLVTISIVVVGCYLFGLSRLLERPALGVYIFVALGAYTFSFNGARQAIAAALCFVGLIYLVERRPVHYFSVVCLASLFHLTALICLPLYFIAVDRSGLRQILGVFLGLFVSFAFLQTFVQFSADLLNDRYAIYAEAGEGGGRVMTAFLLGQGLLLYSLRRRVNDCSGRYARLLNIYLYGLVPPVVAAMSDVNPSGLIRLHYYFSHTALVLWPMYFSSLRDWRSRATGTLMFLMVTMGFFVMTTSTFSDLVPYRVYP